MYWMTAFAEMQKSAFCQLIVFCVSADGNSFLRRHGSRLRFVCQEGIDQSQSAHAPEIHQEDQNQF